MPADPVTLTLPYVTPHGLTVIGVTLGVFLAIWLVRAMLIGAERNQPPALENWATALAWVLLPVWVALLVGTLWALWLVFNGLPSPLADSSFGLGALIAAFLGAPFVIYGTYLRHKTQRLEQEGHMTDRINKAVEQLGADKIVTRDGEEESVPNIEVRMGAILSLERIAQDSTLHDKGRDHVRVMEILCAYIRENSNARKPVDFPLAGWNPLARDDPNDLRQATWTFWWSQLQSRTPLPDKWADPLIPPRIDVQLAISVIGRRSALQRKVEAAWPVPQVSTTAWPFDRKVMHLPEILTSSPQHAADIGRFLSSTHDWQPYSDIYQGYRLDLRGANLQNFDLSSKVSSRSDAVFSGALLSGARLEGADLSGARMEGVDLTGARLDASNLKETSLELANLTDASLIAAFLMQTRLQGAMLCHAQLMWADLRLARMEASFVLEANMTGAKLIGTRLEQANLSRSKLDLAYFWQTVVSSGTILRDASLNGAALRSTDFSSLDMMQKQIDVTFGDGDTSVILSNKINRPAHWAENEITIHEDNAFEAAWYEWLTKSGSALTSTETS